MYKLAYLLFMVNFAFSVFSPAFATQVNQVYSATVPIASQQREDRAGGFDQAFEIVLLKASGQYEKVMNAAFLSAVMPSEPYVQTFSYRENPDYQKFIQQQTDIQDVNLDGELGGAVGKNVQIAPLPYLLDVSFASSIVEKKMSAYGIPIWGHIRPSVLLWLVREDQGERVLVGTSDSDELVEPLLALSELRGVPLYLPVADLQDVSAIDLDDVWGLFPESVELASARYQADAVIMMRIYQSESGLWSGNWLLNLKQTYNVGDRFDTSLDQLLSSLVTDIAARLSQRYAVSKVSGETGSLLDIEVRGIRSFADYVEIQNYLEALPPVANMKMAWVQGEKASYQVQLVGSKQQFYEHIDLGGYLKKDMAVRDASIIDTSISDDQQEDLNLEYEILEALDNATEYYIWSSDNYLSLKNK